MSLESAKKFYELVKSDEELAAKLAAAQSEEEAKAIVQAAGDYDFNQEEWVTALREESGVELEDQDLEKVAGGSFFMAMQGP